MAVCCDSVQLMTTVPVVGLALSRRNTVRRDTGEARVLNVTVSTSVQPVAVCPEGVAPDRVVVTAISPRAFAGNVKDGIV